RCQNRAVKTRNDRRDLKDFPTALIDPNILLVCLVVSREYLHFVCVKRTCRNRNALGSDHLQLFHLRLLFVQVEISKTQTVTISEGKRSDHFIRAGPVRKQRATWIDGKRCDLAVHRCLPSQLVRRHVHLDRHWTLLDPAALQQQASLFDRADVDDRSLRSLRSFIDGPCSIFFLDIGLHGERNFLSLDSNRRLVVVNTRSQINRRFRKLGRCRHHLRHRDRLYVYVYFFQTLRHCRSYFNHTATTEILRK